MLLTIAAPANPQDYKQLKLAEMILYLDFLNLLAYDYAGSWNPTTGHQANLYQSSIYPKSTPFSTDAALKDYIKAGITPDKINLGMPLYGRSFQHTDGLGNPSYGVDKGSWQPGVWDYKVLPPAGAVENIDQQANASYSWDISKRIVVSYDTLAISNAKVDYIRSNRLGGGMFWELSGDRNDSYSLVAN
ncbi:MAG: hypothetical protein Q9164_007166, partial [Protoblastenia rupestris]